MSSRGVKRVSATEAKVHFGELVHEVASSDRPVIIQTRGQDRAVLISLREFQRRQLDAQLEGAPEHLAVREALREGGLLTEPTSHMLREAADYDARYSVEEKRQILEDLRSLDLDPPLSQVIMENRDWQPQSPSSTNE